MALHRWISPVLLVAGVALVVDAVARGSADLILVIVIPVVAGNSVEFLGGVALLVLGLFLLPLSFESAQSPAPEVTAAPPPSPGSTNAGAGGFVLIGPLPVFFGAWRHPPREAYWLAAVLGGIALLAFLLLFFFF